MVLKKQSLRISWTLLFSKLEENRVKEVLGPFLPMSGTLFFQTTKNYKFSLYPFLGFFTTRVLETHLGAACIGFALSKFRPSVGDGAT